MNQLTNLIEALREFGFIIPPEVLNLRHVLIAVKANRFPRNYPGLNPHRGPSRRDRRTWSVQMSTTDAPQRGLTPPSPDSSPVPILDIGHHTGCKLDYKISMGMTVGATPPQTEADLPKPTGGYEILIKLDPPIQKAGELRIESEQHFKTEELCTAVS
jgi:hypothetical protein